MYKQAAEDLNPECRDLNPGPLRGLNATRPMRIVASGIAHHWATKAGRILDQFGPKFNGIIPEQLPTNAETTLFA